MTTQNIFDTSELTELHRSRIKHWCDALRSDRYSKAVHVLHNNHDCFCVMGVACDISNLGIWQSYKYSHLSNSDKPEYYQPECYQYTCSDSNWRERSHAALPKSVFEYFGFHLVNVQPYMMESNVLVNSKTGYGITNISNLNDCGNLTFEQMADVIEDTYLNNQQ